MNNIRKGLLGIVAGSLALAGGYTMDYAANNASRQWIQEHGKETLRSIEDSLDYQFDEIPRVTTGDVNNAGEYNRETERITINPQHCRRNDVGLVDAVKTFEPTCQNILEHEAGHHITYEVAGKEAVFEAWNADSTGWQYVTEGIGEWVDATIGDNRSYLRCEQWPPQYQDPSQASIYGCGERLVTPVLDADMEEGIRQLYEHVPSRNNLQQPKPYVDDMTTLTELASDS